jgi:hypothetical protein
MKFW